VTGRTLLVAVVLVGALAGAWALGAGGSSKSGDEEQALTYQYVAFDQLDPHRISDGAPVAGQNLLEGLVTPDAAGTGVVPATADSWTVSRDGTVYTFHVRRDAKWSDGTPVTAHDFAWTYKRLLTPSTSSLDTLYGSSSYQRTLGIKNAREFQVGKVTDWSQVGVKALDASRLRIVLDTPNTNFLQGMAYTSMVPLPEKNLTRFPYSWQTPARWVGNGPFVVQSWKPDARMVLVRNKHYWDRRSVHLDRVTMSMAPVSDAELRKRYENGQVDVAALGDPTAFQRDAELSKALLRLDEFSVNFLTLVISRNQALKDIRVREAIALAIGRAEVSRAGPLLEPATSLVPRTVPGFDDSVGLQENVAKARRLIAEAGYPGGQAFPTFSVLTSHDDVYVRAVVATLRHNLGIRAVQVVEDPGVQSAVRHEVHPESFAGYFSTGFTAPLTWQSWVSYLYPPSQTELLSLEPDEYTHYQVLEAQGTAESLSAADDYLDEHASTNSRRFAAVAARADATADRARATALYKQAAAIRQSTYEFIPYGYGAVVYAIRPGIKGVHRWTGYFTISFKGVSVS
jgi:ABC-type oligopeptide transport system substrate-binding subunit